MPMNSVGKLPKVEISSRKRSIVLLNHSSVRSAMASASGMRAQNGIAIRLGERFADAARHDPCGMDALATQALDDLLAKLAQADAVARQLGILLRHSKDVAVRGIGVHAEQQVRRGKMEEAQRVRLHDLRQSEDAAQFVGRRRNSDRQQRVAGLGGRDQMADRADAADARHQRRHLVKRTALAELLEAAELGDVEARVLDPPVFVQMQRDLGMAFDAGNRIDDDGAALLHEVSS